MNDSQMPRLIEGNPDDSLADLPGRNADNNPQRVAFSVKESGAWRDVTAAQFNLEVRALAKGLIAQGLEPGDRLGQHARGHAVRPGGHERSHQAQAMLLREGRERCEGLRFVHLRYNLQITA